MAASDTIRVVRVPRDDRMPKCVECKGSWLKRPDADFAPESMGNQKPVREGGWDGSAWCEKHLPKNAVIVDDETASKVVNLFDALATATKAKKR